jgi:hypothetical protein
MHGPPSELGAEACACSPGRALLVTASSVREKRSFSPVIYVRKTAYKANHRRPDKWGTLFFSDGYAFPILYAVNVGPWCCLRAGGDECGLLASFGECQVMAQLVATRWLVFPLMKEDFRVCHPPLARGDFASATLNHQNWTRAECELIGSKRGFAAPRICTDCGLKIALVCEPESSCLQVVTHSQPTRNLGVMSGLSIIPPHSILTSFPSFAF